MAEVEMYTCEMCGVTLPKGQSDEAAEAEAVEYFGKEELDTHGRATVCDPCWEQIMAWVADGMPPRHPDDVDCTWEYAPGLGWKRP